MKKINLIEKHIAQQILRNIIIVTIGFTLLIILVQSLQLFRLIINNGIDIITFISLLLLALPRLLSYILPTAVFIAIIWLFWRLKEDNELQILKAAGVSDWKLLKAPIITSLIITIILYTLLLYINPLAREQFLKLQLSAKSQFSMSLIQAGKFNAINEHITLYIKEINENFSAKEIFLYDQRIDQETQASGQTIIAQEGQLYESSEGFQLIARNGSHQIIREGKLHSLSFDEYIINLNPDDEQLLGRWRKASERSTSDLLNILFSAQSTIQSPEYRYTLWSELHNRITYPLLAPLLCLWACYIMLCARPIYPKIGTLYLPAINPIIIGYIGAILAIFINVMLINSIKNNINNSWILYSLLITSTAALAFIIARKNQEPWTKFADNIKIIKPK